ncbi:hypothetical protein [Streptococcus canis]|uniref:hypothetical protein n=1 Tax=Streptococcus canis TaxID=1329 RepID=UPI001389328E|nr:hypothetical protein [Streptococcus canis]GFG42488.1 hypothetical protein ScFU29_13920 [Streptococcus canis]
MMPKYKMADLAAIAAMTLLTSSQVSANEPIGTYEGSSIPRVSAPCVAESAIISAKFEETTESVGVTQKNLINDAPSADRGTKRYLAPKDK